MQTQLTIVYAARPFEPIAAPAPGDRFTWKGEQWVCRETFDHESGRVPVAAVSLVDGREGMPFADEIHTIFRF